MRMAMTAAAGLAALLGLGGAAAAAPQVLALVSTDAPVALTCRGEACQARLTTFCLQPERASPAAGHRYHLAAPPALRVTGLTAGGGTMALDAALVSIAAERTHLAVRLSLPRAELARHGVEAVQVEVAESATLVPAPEAGDTLPLAEAELATAAGPLRALGTRLVDQDPVRMAAARAMARAANALPGGRLAPQAAAAAVAHALPSEVVAALPEAARPFVADARDYCLLVAGNDVAQTLRQCLEGEHDSLMSYLNLRFWEAVATGS
jgi:hypothetical protein